MQFILSNETQLPFITLVLLKCINRRSASEWFERINCTEEMTATATTSERILKMRGAMERLDIDAYVMPLDEEGRLPWIR